MNEHRLGTSGREAVSRRELVQCGAGEGVAVAAGKRHPGEIDRMRNRWLPTGGVVDAIVEHDMYETGWRISADCCKATELHQRRTVAVEDDDGPRDVERDAEPHAGGTTHGAHLVEMLGPVGQGEELPPALAGGGDHRCCRVHQGQEALEYRRSAGRSPR